jgi:hypothetical protein
VLRVFHVDAGPSVLATVAKPGQANIDPGLALHRR